MEASGCKITLWLGQSPLSMPSACRPLGATAARARLLGWAGHGADQVTRRKVGATARPIPTPLTTAPAINGNTPRTPK